MSEPQLGTPRLTGEMPPIVERRRATVANDIGQLSCTTIVGERRRGIEATTRDEAADVQLPVRRETQRGHRIDATDATITDIGDVRQAKSIDLIRLDILPPAGGPDKRKCPPVLPRDTPSDAGLRRPDPIPREALHRGAGGQSAWPEPALKVDEEDGLCTQLVGERHRRNEMMLRSARLDRRCIRRRKECEKRAREFRCAAHQTHGGIAHTHGGGYMLDQMTGDLPVTGEIACPVMEIRQRRRVSYEAILAPLPIEVPQGAETDNPVGARRGAGQPSFLGNERGPVLTDEQQTVEWLQHLEPFAERLVDDPGRGTQRRTGQPPGHDQSTAQELIVGGLGNAARPCERQRPLVGIGSVACIYALANSQKINRPVGCRCPPERRPPSPRAHAIDVASLLAEVVDIAGFEGSIADQPQRQSILHQRHIDNGPGIRPAPAMRGGGDAGPRGSRKRIQNRRTRLDPHEPA